MWQAHNEGHYQIHVSVGDEPIRGSPFGMSCHLHFTHSISSPPFLLPVVYVSPRIDASLCKADCAEGLNIAMDSVTTVCVVRFFFSCAIFLLTNSLVSIDDIHTFWHSRHARRTERECVHERRQDRR